MGDWREMERALEERVAGMKAAGASREERANATHEERAAMLGDRSAAFVRATQGRGKPGARMIHGSGKKPGEK